MGKLKKLDCNERAEELLNVGYLVWVLVQVRSLC